MALRTKHPRAKLDPSTAGIGGTELSLVQVFHVSQLFLHGGNLRMLGSAGQSEGSFQRTLLTPLAASVEKSTCFSLTRAGKSVRGSDWLSLSLSLHPGEYASRGVVPVREAWEEMGDPSPKQVKVRGPGLSPWGGRGGWRWGKGWQASSGREKLFQARGGSPQLRSWLFLAYSFGGVRMRKNWPVCLHAVYRLLWAMPPP